MIGRMSEIKPRRIQTYREFWDFYVSQHLNPICRTLHFVGTLGAIACLIAGMIVSPVYFLAAPFAGYSLAWIGHFGFERNRPATFTYPIWSLISDFVMFSLIISGKMGAEVERVSLNRPA